MIAMKAAGVHRVVGVSSTAMSREDLAAFVADVLERDLHVTEAPFAASR